MREKVTRNGKRTGLATKNSVTLKNSSDRRSKESRNNEEIPKNRKEVTRCVIEVKKGKEGGMDWYSKESQKNRKESRGNGV